MLNLLNILRYFVLVAFVICNAIIISVAVWNLSIVEVIFVSTTAKMVDAYLIFLGTFGLLLIFPILFFELYGKDVFLGRVWFELLWVGLFSFMDLVGAAVTTAHSGSQTCDPRVLASLTPIQESPCASNQVLQAFTWICTILLLGYLTLLFILTMVMRRENPSIWHHSVRKFPLMKGQALKSVPASPSLPTFRRQSIVAPRPRRIAALREAILSYRSGLSLEYEVEPYRTPDLAPVAPAQMSRMWSTLPSSSLPIPTPSQQQPVFATPFYHTSVQTAIEHQPQLPLHAQQSQPRQLPPSPPPLGDWPRLDATSRPRNVKRKTLTESLPRAEVEPAPQPQNQSRPGAVPRLQPPLQVHYPNPPRSHPPSQSRRQPLPQTTASNSTAVPYAFDAEALSAALTPLASSQPTPRQSSWRPSGPRRPSYPLNDGRPVPLDLSNISSFRSPGFR